MAGVKKSVAQSLAANFTNLAISLLLVIIVSRILPPTVIGSYVMAYSVIMLVDPIRELQLPSYVMRQETIDRERLGPIGFVSLVTSAVALIACVIGAVIFWRSYDTPAAGNCLLIMSLAFVSRPLSQTAMALLARDLRYGPIAGIRLSSAILKCTVTLALIWFFGLGAEALAWGIFAETMLELVALKFVASELRLVRPSSRGSKVVFAYCTQFAGANLATTISVALAPLLIGAYQGLAVTAFFNRGRTVVGFFRSGVERAILPIVMREFSRVQGDRESVRSVYLAAISSLTGISWPALACFIVLAEPLILTLFGEAWRASIPLSQVLSLGAVVFAATALSPQVHAALGETKLLLMRQALMQIPRIALIFFTAPIGAMAVAWGLFFATILGFIVNQRLLTQSLNANLLDFVRTVSKSALVGVVTGLGAYASMRLMPIQLEPWREMIVHSSVGVLTWLAMLILTRHLLFTELRAAWRRFRGRYQSTSAE